MPFIFFVFEYAWNPLDSVRGLEFGPNNVGYFFPPVPLKKTYCTIRPMFTPLMYIVSVYILYLFVFILSPPPPYILPFIIHFSVVYPRSYFSRYFCFKIFLLFSIPSPPANQHRSGGGGKFSYIYPRCPVFNIGSHRVSVCYSGMYVPHWYCMDQWIPAGDTVGTIAFCI